MNTYLYSLLLGFIYILPLFLANVLYLDDARRSFVNNAGTWLSEGRPLMAGIHYFINFGTKVFDLAPLTQIIGIAVLCYAGYLFIKKYCSDMPVYLKVFCIVSLITSPFFLGNIAFGFESIGFCISLAIPILLCCVSDDISWIKTFGLFFVGMIATMSIYQSSLSALFIIAMVALYLQPTKWSVFSARIAGSLVGMFVYMLTIAKTITRYGYQGMSSSSYVFSIDKIAQNFNNFFMQYIDLFFADFATTCLFILITLGCLASIGMYIVGQNKKHLWVFLLPIMAFFMTILPMCFLSNTVCLPRSVLSFNIVLFFITILLAQLCMRFAIVKGILVFMFLWMFSFNYMFCRTLVAQEKFEDFVCTCMFYDIGKLDINKNAKYYYGGNELVCHEILEARKKYKIFNGINNVQFKPGRVFWSGKISHYLNYVVRKTPKSFDIKNTTILASHNLYFIVGDKNNIVIWIK